MKGISLAIRKKTIYPLGIILKGDQYPLKVKVMSPLNDLHVTNG
jgi:hypothetical protein